MGPSIGRIQSTGVVFDDDDDDVEVARVCFGCALLCSVLFFEGMFWLRLCVRVSPFTPAKTSNIECTDVSLPVCVG